MGDDLDDIAALRGDGDLVAYLLSLTSTAPAKAPAGPVPEPDDGPEFHIPRPGAWPCGTAPSGPTPPPCNGCDQKGTA